MFTIRPMRPDDNPAVLAVIQQCVLEFGYTHSPYVTHAQEEGDIHGHCSGPKSRIYVLQNAQGNIVGAGGFAPVYGAEDLCEIQRVYFLPEARGHGQGRKMVERLMEEAMAFDYRAFYIETVPEMTTAIALYTKLGFRASPRQGTGGHHDCCSVFMLRPINQRKSA